MLHKLAFLSLHIPEFQRCRVYLVSSHIRNCSVEECNYMQHGNCRVDGVNINCFRLLSRLNHVWDGSQVCHPLKWNVHLCVFCIRSAEYFLHFVEIKTKIRDEIIKKGEEWCNGELQNLFLFPSTVRWLYQGR